MRALCPVHGLPDCSPLLNGCSELTARMTTWTVYDHPSDFPDHFVAREFVIGVGTVQPTESFIQSTDLEVIREAMWDMNKYPLDRSDGDDPTILETWI